MARHVDMVTGTFEDNDDEQIAGSLCKAIYDLVNGKTIQEVSMTRKGRQLWAVVVWDD